MRRFAIPPVAAAVLAVSSAGLASAQTADTTVTFTVSTGALTISAPANASLGTGTPGSTLSAQIGTVTVTDNRGEPATATWTATVGLATAFTRNGGTETVPSSGVRYSSGGLVTPPATIGTGFTPGQPLGSTADAAAITTNPTAFSWSGSGNNRASWNPLVVVDIPDTAVGGTYTGTIRHSVTGTPGGTT